MYFHNLIDEIYLWGEKFKQSEISNPSIISAYYNSNHEKYILVNDHIILYYAPKHIISIEYHTEQELQQIINYDLQLKIEEILLNKL